MLVFLAYTVEIMYPSSLLDPNLTLPAHFSSLGAESPPDNGADHEQPHELYWREHRYPWK